MSSQRRSYEQGHKPKCLVVVDDTAEGDRAVVLVDEVERLVRVYRLHLPIM